MRIFNLMHGELEHSRDRDGYRLRAARVGARVGASAIGGTVYDLPAGERTFPYHYHHGVEEWLIVVDGTPTLRDPAGERELHRGDVVCFPSGSAGAHAVRGPGRVLILSAGRSPSISVYPDSDKVGTRPDDDGDVLNFRRGHAVEYWDGE